MKAFKEPYDLIDWSSKAMFNKSINNHWTLQPQKVTETETEKFQAQALATTASSAFHRWSTFL